MSRRGNPEDRGSVEVTSLPDLSWYPGAVDTEAPSPAFQGLGESAPQEGLLLPSLD